MEENIFDKKLSEFEKKLQTFHMPRYRELPDIDLAGAAAAPYVSEQGYICVRYAQAEATEDWMSGTGSVNKPALVFEGRVAE